MLPIVRVPVSPAATRVVRTYPDGANMTRIREQHISVKRRPSQLFEIVSPALTVAHIPDGRNSTAGPLDLREESPASLARQKRWKR